MSLSRAQAQAVIDIVAADPDCQKIIRSPGHPEGGTATQVFGWVSGGIIYWRVLERFGLAGWVRNALAEPFVDDHQWQKMICGGIVAVTVAAIDPKRGRVPGLKDVEGSQREPGGWAHFATLLKMKDGTEYIMDWHKTLVISNPWVSRHRDWKVATNEIPFASFPVSGLEG
jgi:hypothetical protein